MHVCPLRYSTSLSLVQSLSAHSPIIEEWAGELALVVSAPKSMISQFTPQFVQSNIHPQVTLNNSLPPLEKTPRIPGVTIKAHFIFNAHGKFIVTRASPCINILKDLAGTNWNQQMETMHITYMSLI